jgi:hypothetical protein
MCGRSPVFSAIWTPELYVFQLVSLLQAEEGHLEESKCASRIFPLCTRACHNEC